MSISNAPSPFVSVLIVTRNRVDYLKECLDSLEADPPACAFEVILVINGVDRETSTFLQQRKEKIGFCLVSVDQTTPAAARNAGLDFARGRYVCFLDDDVILPRGYFQKFVATLQCHSEIEVLGGPDRTPNQARAIERAIGLALKSPLATARTRHRHGGGGSGLAPVAACEAKLILCNLWMLRSLFSEEGVRFDARFMRNEENVLLFGLRDRRVYFISEGFVFHRRRRAVRLFAKAVMRSGFFRARSFFLYPGSVGPEYFVPSVFVAYLLVLAVSPSFMLAVPLFVYCVLNAVFAIRISRREKDLFLAPLVMVYQFLINIFYGLGFVTGFFRRSIG